ARREALDRRRGDGEIVLGGEVVEIVGRPRRNEVAEALDLAKSVGAAERPGRVADIALVDRPVSILGHGDAERVAVAQGCTRVGRVLGNPQRALGDAAAAARNRAAGHSGIAIRTRIIKIEGLSRPVAIAQPGVPLIEVTHREYGTRDVAAGP